MLRCVSGSLVRRRCIALVRPSHYFFLGHASLVSPSASYSSKTATASAAQRSRSRGGHTLARHRSTLDETAPQPKKQARKPRLSLHRTSLLEQLRETDSASSIPRSGDAIHEHEATTQANTLLVSSRHDASECAAAPYVSSPKLISAQRQAEANAATSASRHVHADATANPSFPAAASLLQQQEQQRALRDAFTYARQHHNVKLRKDARLYRAECKAFRQSHQGRSPTTQEVSPTVAVPLAPVSVLQTLAHTDRRRSLLHSAAEDALLLHNAVAKNELVKSTTPQLVRCLRCFHVYTARPRTLWGSEVEQSGIEYEKVQAQLAADGQLQRRPWLRKRTGSVGRRQRAQQENPTCCPQCGSPRAQWMMEYVHHHTHEKH